MMSPSECKCGLDFRSTCDMALTQSGSPPAAGGQRSGSGSILLLEEASPMWKPRTRWPKYATFQILLPADLASRWEGVLNSKCRLRRRELQSSLGAAAEYSIENWEDEIAFLFVLPTQGLPATIQITINGKSPRSSEAVAFVRQIEQALVGEGAWRETNELEQLEDVAAGRRRRPLARLASMPRQSGCT